MGVIPRHVTLRSMASSIASKANPSTIRIIFASLVTYTSAGFADPVSPKAAPTQQRCWLSERR